MNFTYNPYYEVKVNTDGVETTEWALNSGRRINTGQSATQLLSIPNNRFVKKVVTINLYKDYQGGDTDTTGIPTVLSALTAAGSGYLSAKNVSTTSTGNGVGLTVDIDTNTSGVIQSISINQTGDNYAVTEAINIDGGTSTASFTVTDVDNPIAVSDSFTIIGTTSNNDAISVNLSNDNVSLTADESGTVTGYSLGAVSVEAYEGNVQIDPVAGVGSATSGKVYLYEVINVGTGDYVANTTYSTSYLTENVNSGQNGSGLTITTVGTSLDDTITATLNEIEVRGTGYKVGDILNVGSGDGQIRITDVAGSFYIDDVNVTDTSITKGAKTVNSSDKTIDFGAPSLMDAETATVTYKVTITRRWKN